MENLKKYETTNWAWDYLDLDDLKYNGKGIDIAIVDTGYDDSIPALKHIDKCNTIDFTGTESKKIVAKLSENKSFDDQIKYLKKDHNWDQVQSDAHRKFHGSNLAAIIGGRETSQGNLSGIAHKSNLHILKIYVDPSQSSQCNCTIVPQMLTVAIMWAIAKGVQVVNLSQSSNYCSKALHQVVRAAYFSNTILVAAAGNTPSPGDMSIDYPAAFQKTLAIGSYNEKIEVDPNTDKGTLLDFALPGKNVPSLIDPQNIKLSGSSIACAFATAIIALYLQKSGNLSYHKLKKDLINNADRDTTDNHNGEWGYGRIKPKNLLK